MKKICKSCRTEFYVTIESMSRPISGDVCPSCLTRLATATDAAAFRPIIDMIDAPTLVMQPDSRLVLTANARAAAVFGKSATEMEGHSGGAAFGCVHAVPPARCGEDSTCATCRIKTAVAETLASGKPYSAITMTLPIACDDDEVPHTVTVSTERTGPFALLRIDRLQAEP